MNTVADLIRTHNVEIDPHLDRDLTVPVSAGLQRQGDIIVIPSGEAPAALRPVPREGIPVVRGENGGNTHLLLASGDVLFGATDVPGQNIGHVTVPAGATAYLAHPEHGYAGIAPGTYVIRRQREWANEVRMVAD